MKRTQCRTCKWRYWHRNIGEWHCNWSDCHSETCLHIEHGKKVDRRGDDPENCKLYEEGKMLRRKQAAKGNPVEYVEVDR